MYEIITEYHARAVHSKPKIFDIEINKMSTPTLWLDRFIQW